jgi:hypothetical protein
VRIFTDGRNIKCWYGVRSCAQDSYIYCKNASKLRHLCGRVTENKTAMKEIKPRNNLFSVLWLYKCAEFNKKIQSHPLLDPGHASSSTHARWLGKHFHLCLGPWTQRCTWKWISWFRRKKSSMLTVIDCNTVSDLLDSKKINQKTHQKQM